MKINPKAGKVQPQNKSAQMVSHLRTKIKVVKTAKVKQVKSASKALPIKKATYKKGK